MQKKPTICKESAANTNNSVMLSGLFHGGLKFVFLSTSLLPYDPLFFSLYALLIEDNHAGKEKKNDLISTNEKLLFSVFIHIGFLLQW